MGPFMNGRRGGLPSLNGHHARSPRQDLAGLAMAPASEIPTWFCPGMALGQDLSPWRRPDGRSPWSALGARLGGPRRCKKVLCARLLELADRGHGEALPRGADGNSCIGRRGGPQEGPGEGDGPDLSLWAAFGPGGIDPRYWVTGCPNGTSDGRTHSRDESGYRDRGVTRKRMLCRPSKAIRQWPVGGATGGGVRWNSKKATIWALLASEGS